MNQLSGGQKEFARVVADNYSMMEEQLQEAAAKNHNLLVENGILLAERNMLIEQLNEARREARRLQAVASTFGGQARALQAVFSSITELAVKNGIEAAEQAPAEAQEAPQSAAPEKAPETPAPSATAGEALKVDWAPAPRSLNG